MDWYVDLVSSVNRINEANRDKLCKSFIDNEISNISDINTLGALLNVAQSLLRLKLEQVESLELELDDLAAKQGEEEAQHNQQIEELLNQLARKDAGFTRNGSETEDDLRQLLQASELRAEKLLSELQSQEQEQLSNKLEMERLVDQVSTLENERSQLKREVLALREEIREQRKDIDPLPEDFQKRHQQLTDSLRQKNKHISQLLNELEGIEKENLTLREKLDSVKSELLKATENINHTTKEIAALQLKKEEQAEQLQELYQMCEALRNQVKDLVSDKQKRDTELEIFDRDIDIRIQECKKMLEEKDKELSLLYEKLSSNTMQGQAFVHECESSRVALLSQTLQKRENQIEDLQAQLAQATKDLMESANLLENVRPSSQSIEVKDISSSQKLVESTEEKIKILKQKLQDAEKDSEEKSEDITQLIIQLRRYEAGEFGLSEAVAQIKELSQQQLVRDKHIEELIDSINSLRNTCDSLEEQNLVLRDRLGLPADEHISINKTTLKKEEQHLIQVQKEKIDNLEEELVELKIDRRKLSQQVLMLCKKLQDPETHPQQSQKGTAHKLLTRAQADSRAASRKIRKLQQEQQRWEIERQSLIEENEALRQGLHEILDSVHKQDGKSSVLVESKGLENLLHALDSRHVSGWYHPAMRLQAELNTLEGNNASLREQLRRSRDDEAKSQAELLKARMLITKLEQGVSGSQSTTVNYQPSKSVNEEEYSLPLCEDSSVSVLDIINKLNRHLLQVLNEYEIEKGHVATLVSIQKELQHELDMLVTQLACASQQQKEEKDKWEEDKLMHQEEIDILTAQLTASETQVAQLTSAFQSFSSQDADKRISPHNVLETATLAAEKALLERKASSAIRLAEHAKGQLRQTKNECNAVRNKMVHRLGELLHFKKFYVMHLSELETMLANSASMESLQSANRQADELTSKYTLSLREQEISITKMNREIKALMFELQTEKQEKFEVMKHLENANRKLKASSWAIDDTENEKMVQLAAAETRELCERQRASHAEKMSDFAKAELKQVTDRCLALEQEISMHITLNHELKMKLSVLEEQCSKMVTPDERDELETQLAHARAEVVELQANREQLQELTDIAQDQINILDHLHDSCEVQLDSLRQTVYELQSKSDQASMIARLKEDLCASQLSQMATLNHVKRLEAEMHRLQALCDHQGRNMDDLHKELNKSKLKHIDISRDLWHELQKAKTELNSKLIAEEQNKLIGHQYLELKNSVLAQHSDLECQKSLELWASKLTDITLKELKSSRHCEALEAQVKQTEDRLAKQEDLISALEQQILFFDAQAISSTLQIAEEENREEHHESSTLKEPQKQGQIQGNEVYQEIFLEKDNQSGKSPLHRPSIQPQIEQPQHGIDEIDKDFLRAEVKSLKAEVTNLTELLDKRMEELHSYNQLITEMQQSHLEVQKNLKLRCEELENALSSRKSFDNNGRVDPENDETKDHNKIALQATVDSLQSIINQKEETISRYQSLLRDVREEDARLLSALQDRLHSMQADLSAQEQAYIRLKNSLRQHPMDSNSGVSSKAALDAQLTRVNELEDEVALLNTKLSAVTAELQTAQRESHHWSSVAKQHLAALEEVSQRTAEQNTKGTELKKSDSQLLTNESSPSISSCVPGFQMEFEEIQNDSNFRNVRKVHGSSSTKSFEKLSRGRLLQLNLHLSEDIRALQSKLRALEESERQSKKEIQRLRDQIPIYSRRTLRPVSDDPQSDREIELLRKIQELQEQISKLKTDSEKADIQRSQQEFKKIKSAENVARWDERKKHQNQIEKLKIHLQEQTDELTLLNDKIERMHSTIHRLEREKVALEHQLKNLQSLERERIKLEHELKISKENEVAQCMVEEMQHERDKLLAEVSILKSKQTGGMKDKREFCNEKVRQDNAALLRSNLSLECENLELKLELEKLRAEAPCLQHKAKVEVSRLEHYEGMGVIRSKEIKPQMQGKLETENRKLRDHCQDLQDQLEHANRQLKKLEAILDGSKSASFVSELQQKTQLLNKVKVLLERAAVKERALSEQVQNLQDMLARKSDLRK